MKCKEKHDYWLNKWKELMCNKSDCADCEIPNDTRKNTGCPGRYAVEL